MLVIYLLKISKVELFIGLANYVGPIPSTWHVLLLIFSRLDTTTKFDYFWFYAHVK